jgi:hypothetical protein
MLLASLPFSFAYKASEMLWRAAAATDRPDDYTSQYW